MKRMCRYRIGLLLVLATAVLLSSCSSLTATDLEPILCHREIDAGMLKGTDVGLLFITIENHGSDAGPSTTQVAFTTNSPQTPRVQLEVPTPGIPSGTAIWVMVNLPFNAATNSFLHPAGKITITVDVRHVLPETNRKNDMLITNCNDGT